MTKQIVAISECGDYTSRSISRTLSKIVDSAGFPEVKNKTVLLKPNILSGSSPEKAVTTHPELIRAVIRLVFARGASRILVGDSPGVGSPDIAGKKSGIKTVVQEEGAEWTLFNESIRLQAPDGKKQNQFYPTRQWEEADVLISLPKMKTHEMMYYTGAIKNLFGMIPGLKKSRFHLNYPEKEDFAALIVDLFQALKPSYAIMDAITAMEGPGPGSGTPINVGLLMGSSNLLALDWAAATIMGYDGMGIPILKDALERKAWLESPHEIEYPLLNPEDLILKQFKRVHILKDTGFIKKMVPQRMYGFIRNLYVPRPFFSKKSCIGCGECVRICPAKALTLKGKGKQARVLIDYDLCIRCYCCHEVCPVEAIRIGRI